VVAVEVSTQIANWALDRYFQPSKADAASASEGWTADEAE
jgi:hypothetical protein